MTSGDHHISFNQIVQQTNYVINGGKFKHGLLSRAVIATQRNDFRVLNAVVTQF